MSISGGGSWGGSDALSGGNSGDKGSDSRSRAGQGPNRSDASLSGGSRGNQSATSGDRGSDGGLSRGRSLGSLKAELDRRDRAAVAALGPDGRNVNVASDVFNDDEEGINSIGEALDRFGSWVQDRVGAGAPGGFAKSDAAGMLSRAAGFLTGGFVGSALAGAAHTAYSAPPGNRIGTAAKVVGSLAGAVPGTAGLAASLGATGLGLVDQYVTDLDDLPAGSPVTAAAQSLNSVGLDDFPGGSQGGDNPLLKPTASTALSAARTGDTGSDTKKPNPNTIRRTLSPLNISYARLRGIEELL